jgi:hypothetical protein
MTESVGVVRRRILDVSDASDTKREDHEAATQE